ncbi:MAG: hypothetical protein FWF01_01095 [Alphaproteobacteria bacterium]|nr:hypothetical protein [Alphaproteobacteria bacterium]
MMKILIASMALIVIAAQPALAHGRHAPPPPPRHNTHRHAVPARPAPAPVRHVVHHHHRTHVVPVHTTKQKSNVVYVYNTLPVIGWFYNSGRYGFHFVMR